MTLVIMAAGMGSRYGGLKQLDPIGKNGEVIVDYSVFDAVKAGFDRVVFIIKEENLELFRESVGKRAEEKCKVEYVFQKLDYLPDCDVVIPQTRKKPWGTAHAVLCCKDVVKDNFAVINADDFYGEDAFKLLADHLKTAQGGDFCMIGYQLKNTLTENGSVSRGVCEFDDNSLLTSVCERTKIQRNNGVIQFFEEGSGWVDLKEDTTVSMNCWGFTPKLFDEISKEISGFFKDNADKLEKAEFYLPSVVQNMIDKKECTAKVMTTTAKWYGVTYPEDKAFVKTSIANLIKNGEYPEKL